MLSKFLDNQSSDPHEVPTSKMKQEKYTTSTDQELVEHSQSRPSERDDSIDIPSIPTYNEIVEVELHSSEDGDRKRDQQQHEDTAGMEDTHGEPEFDKGYAWVVLAAATTISTFSWGANSAFGVFLSYFLSNNVYPDASDLDFAFVGGLSFGLGLMASPIPSVLLKRFPYQAVIMVGACVQSGGLISASFAKKIWHLYLSQGVLQGLGISLVFIPANAALPQWFKARRGIANGIFTAGTGLGGIIFSFTVQALIDNLGIAWAQRITGFMSLFACVIAGSLIRGRHGRQKGGVKAPARFYDSSLLRRTDLYVIVAWGTLTMLGYGILLYTMSAYSVSIGLTHSQGAAVSACVCAGVTVGRAIMGWLMDTYGTVNIALCSTFCTCIFLFAMWINAHSYGVMIALAILVGLVMSSASTCFPPVSASIVELELLVPFYSMSWFIIGGAGIFAEPMAIKLRINDKYLYTQIFTGLLYFVGGLFLLVGRANKVRSVLHQRALDEDSIQGNNNNNSEKLGAEKGAEKQTTVWETSPSNEENRKSLDSSPSFFTCMTYITKV